PLRVGARALRERGQPVAFALQERIAGVGFFHLLGALGGRREHVRHVLGVSERVRPIEQAREPIVVPLHPRQRGVDQAAQGQERAERERAREEQRGDQRELVSVVVEVRQRELVHDQAEADQRHHRAEEIDDECGAIELARKHPLPPADLRHGPRPRFHDAMAPARDLVMEGPVDRPIGPIAVIVWGPWGRSSGGPVPELPEVEVTRRRIAPHLVGRRIRRVRTTRPSYFFVTSPARLRRALAGRTAVALARHGKYLLAELDDGARLVLHLGMTGQLFSEGAKSPRLFSARASLAPGQQPNFRPDAHTHLCFEFEDGGPEVYLRDTRKFGKVLWLAGGEAHPRLARLGIDALEMDGARLFAATRKRRVALKNPLLDQSIPAGAGNIYPDGA